MNNIYIKSFILFLSAFLIFGCSTTHLLKSAAGESSPINKTPTKVIFASKDDDEVIVCVNTLELSIVDGEEVNSTDEEVYNFSIPIKKVNKLKQLTINKNNYLTFEPKMSNVSKGCDYSGNKIEIIEYAIDNTSVDKAKIVKSNRKNSNEVVYVIYRNSNPIQVGYISTKPIYKNIKSIEVPIHRSYTYSHETINSKPYLYLALPFAIAADILAAPFFAGYCLGDGDLDCH